MENAFDDVPMELNPDEATEYIDKIFVAEEERSQNVANGIDANLPSPVCKYFIISRRRILMSICRIPLFIKS